MGRHALQYQMNHLLLTYSDITRASYICFRCGTYSRSQLAYNAEVPESTKTQERNREDNPALNNLCRTLVDCLGNSALSNFLYLVLPGVQRLLL